MRHLKYYLKRLYRGFKAALTIACLIALLWLIVYGCAYMIGLGFTQGTAEAIIGILNQMLPSGGLPI